MVTTTTTDWNTTHARYISDVNSLDSDTNIHAIDTPKKIKKDVRRLMNDVDNHQDTTTTPNQHDVAIRNVAPSNGGERKSKRQRRTTSFYFEESLMMPSSRESKFFQRPLPPSSSSHMKWNQILQQIQFVDVDMHDDERHDDIPKMDSSTSGEPEQNSEATGLPQHSISNDFDGNVLTSQPNCSTIRKSARLSQEQTKSSFKTVKGVPNGLVRLQPSRVIDGVSFSDACVGGPSLQLGVEESLSPDIPIVTRKSARLETKHEMTKMETLPTEKQKTKKIENSNRKDKQKSKQVCFEENKPNVTAASLLTSCPLDLQTIPDNEKIIIKSSRKSIRRVGAQAKPPADNRRESHYGHIKPQTASIRKPTLSDGWKVVGDPFPSERVCTGGYLVSFSVLLDRYDRNAKLGKYERVDFGPTIDTAKIAIMNTMKLLRNQGEDECKLDTEVALDDGHRVNKRLITGFEDQERLERAREKESDFFAARRYSAKPPKKSKDVAEMSKLAKAPIMFEDDRLRRQSFTSCVSPCTLCYGSISTNLEPKNLAHSLMPLYRPFDPEQVLESDGEEVGTQSRTKARRSSSIAQKGLQTLMALKELSNTLNFVEEFYAGYHKWNVIVHQS